MERTLKILNLVFFIAMIAVNVLGEALPLGRGSTGEISTKYSNLFTPAPITFSIWGIIYLFVAVFAIYQLDLGNKNPSINLLIHNIGLWFIISCTMNIGWMLSWHYDVIWLSMVFMLGLLFSLIMISTGFSRIEEAQFMTKVSAAGFNIYLGWICAATIANVSVLLVSLNWNRFGLSEELWTVIVIIVGTVLGVLFITRRQNYVSSLAIIWAYCGILVKHISQKGYAGKYPLIITITILCIFVILASALFKMMLNPSRNIQ